jgi:hypothetical protein
MSEEYDGKLSRVKRRQFAIRNSQFAVRGPRFGCRGFEMASRKPDELYRSAGLVPLPIDGQEIDRATAAYQWGFSVRPDEEPLSGSDRGLRSLW